MKIAKGVFKIFAAGLFILAILFASFALWIEFRPKDCWSWQEESSFNEETKLMNLAGTIEKKQENGKTYVRLCN
ncbi:hypothetical protein EOM57_04415 [Candidatus Saccharibacteria bacterium]|nr:hypothetical protein [Candidatus Saccharibacteria bacterium]